MSDFHNPYQFIQTTGRVNGSPTSTEPYENIKNGTTQTSARHDLWLKDTFSGRVICGLKLITPTVVGAEQKGDSPAKVELYERAGKPAIPGNSLRGMVGSVAETLSQSALRVLEDRSYSVRKTMASGDSKLSAVGMLTSLNDGENPTHLIPLSLPVIKQNNNGKFSLSDEWLTVFGNERGIWRNHLAAYVNGYRKTKLPKGKEILNEHGFLFPQPKSFHAIFNHEFYYAKLFELPDTSISIPLSAAKNEALNKKQDQNYDQYLLGGVIQDHNNILTEEKYQSLVSNKDEEADLYTKGILRVLGVFPDRREIMPNTKKHELFIPYDESKLPEPIPVQPNAIKDFIEIASERSESTKKKDIKLPLVLQGYEHWQPKNGDLVFFDIEKDEHGDICVSEISISSIWRKRIPHTPHEYFNGNLAPLKPGRNVLTPAELLFGVVDEEKSVDEPQGRALASRLRFSDAVLPQDHDVSFDKPKTLKILSSPKPPSPAMYFHRKGQPKSYVSKTDLAKGTAQDIRPNGRKVYLHHRADAANKASEKKAYWESQFTQGSKARLEQKLSCTPMLPNDNDQQPDFYFHIDFENLSQAELGLLLTSLQPDKKHQHRLGLGKPLGLGSVRVEIVGAFFVDRQTRYSRDALSCANRYSQVWVHSQDLNAYPGWSARYPDEYQALQLHQNAVGDEHAPIKLSVEQVFDQTLVDQDTLHCLKIAGNPENLSAPVHPPLVTTQQAGQTSAEEETFQWFVSNDHKDNSSRQALGYIQKGQSLPTLKKLVKRDKS